MSSSELHSLHFHTQISPLTSACFGLLRVSRLPMGSGNSVYGTWLCTTSFESTLFQEQWLISMFFPTLSTPCAAGIR